MASVRLAPSASDDIVDPPVCAVVDGARPPPSSPAAASSVESLPSPVVAGFGFTRPSISVAESKPVGFRAVSDGVLCSGLASLSPGSAAFGTRGGELADGNFRDADDDLADSLLGDVIPLTPPLTGCRADAPISGSEFLADTPEVWDGEDSDFERFFLGVLGFLVFLPRPISHPPFRQRLIWFSSRALSR